MERLFTLLLEFYHEKVDCAVADVLHFMRLGIHKERIAIPQIPRIRLSRRLDFEFSAVAYKYDMVGVAVHRGSVARLECDFRNAYTAVFQQVA